MNKGREKEDAYRKKRKMYMAASTARGAREGYLNPDIAEDVLECYQKYADSDELVIPSGKEFHSMPPTAAGRKYFANSLAMLMHARDRFSGMAEHKKDGVTGKVDPLFFEGLEETCQVIDKVIGDYFTASGLTLKGEQIKDKSVRKKGRMDFLMSRLLYEKTIRQNLMNYGVRIIEKLGKDEDTTKLISLYQSFSDPIFDRMVDSEPLAELLYADVVRKLTTLTENAVKEAAKYKAYVKVFKEKLYPMFYSKDTDPTSRDILKAAFLEYRNYIEMNLKRLADIRESCLYYGMCVLKSEPVDRIMYEKIQKCINLEAEFMDDSILLSDLPGFQTHTGSNDKKVEVALDFETIQNETNEIRGYFNTHPYQFDGQCLRSAINDIETLAATLAKAEAISVAIEEFSKTKKAGKLKADDWFDLLDSWVFCECLMRVGYPIIDFINEHSDDNVGNATKAFSTLLPNISYSTAEKTVRFALREVMIERSGLDV
ncbi:MAG: hypothetical protein K6B14_06035 [Lachnospiraceae bacterium]|nr:hypothetical protein [Lachnospiraceae bacterium]